MPRTAEKLITTVELAKRWGLSPRSIEARRFRGDPPNYVRIGAGPRAKVRYRLADIEAFERENTKEHAKCPP